MTPKIYCALLLALFVAGTISCTKNSPGGTNFENNEGIALNLDVYATQADYNNGTNVFTHVKVGKNGSTNIPASKLTVGHWYYMDIYSDDLTYTNWALDDSYVIGSDSATPQRFKYGAISTVGLESIQTNARLSLLGNGTSTKWKAVGALDLATGDNIWNTLSALQRSATLIINKDHTGWWYYLSGTDTVGRTNFTFHNSVLTYPLYTLFPDTNNGLVFFIENTNVNPTTTTYQPPTINTAITLMNGVLYVIARQ